MEKSPETKKHYWGVMQRDKVLFEGSFNQCWKHLVTQYGDMIVDELVTNGIRITRIG